jgi:type I restriction enzyme S subunit
MVSELHIRATVNQAIAALELRGCAASSAAYVKASLRNNYEAIRRTSSGGVQPNLNLGLVRAIPVPLPPIREMSRVVAELDRRLSIVYQLGVVLDAGFFRAERLRQSVLKRAFEGKLVPRDPADEPATALLARIQATRTADIASARPPRTRRPRKVPTA